MSESIPCPVCEKEQTELFLKRDQVPVNQNLVVSTLKNAQNISKRELSLYRCISCGFLFNGTFDLSLLQYGNFYDNSQDQSSCFKSHLDSLLDELIQQRGFKKHLFVEIGCGKGQFLKSIIGHPLSQNSGIGFDPTYIGKQTVYDGRLQFEKRFYDETCSHAETDVVICRHVIEHIPDPVQFLKVVKNALSKSPNVRLFFETPCLNWILENKVIWDFFYEHCSYFTKNSLSLAFEKAGFQIEEVRSVFGGQYLWLEASIGPRKRELFSTQNILDLMDHYFTSEKSIRKLWQQKIQKLLESGKLAIWGAGAKGVTFANLFDPNRKFLDCVIDINPRKQHHFLPGTGHQIIGVEELKNRELTTAILMNPNYLRENQKLLEKHSISINLVCS